MQALMTINRTALAVERSQSRVKISHARLRNSRGLAAYIFQL